MELNFPHTCSAIDDGISNARNLIESTFGDFVSDLCHEAKIEYNTYLILSRLTERYTDVLQDKIACIFEKVKRTNIDMRDAANRQLSQLEEEIEDLKKEIENAKSEEESK